MKAVISVALKDLRILWRDKLGLFWVLMFPILMALFFGAIFGGSGSNSKAMKIATIAEPGDSTAQLFFKQLDNSDVLRTVEMGIDSARALVGQGKLVAFIEYKSDANGSDFIFSSSPPEILIGVDPTRKAEIGYLQGLVNQAYFVQLQSKMSNPEILKKSLDIGIQSIDTSTRLSANQKSDFKGFMSSLSSFLSSVDTDSDSARGASEENYSPFQEPKLVLEEITADSAFPRSSFEITFPQSIQWALIACAAAFSLSIVRERTSGTYTRLRMAPISRSQILIGKGLACFTACISAATLLLAIGVIIFGVRITWVGGLLAALFSAAFCFVGIMMLISVLGKTEQAVGGAGWAVLLIMSMTGGGMVPLLVMPSWMIKLGHISPVKWSILALEGAIWRGFGVSEMLTPIIVLLSIGLGGFMVGVTILSRQD